MKQKEKARIVYEQCLGKEIRAHQWEILKQQLTEAKMPITADNLRFVAKCKKVAPRKGIQAKVLQLLIQLSLDLEDSVNGVTLKEYIYTKHPSISKHKFYRVFRSEGMNYKNDATYRIADIPEVFYKLFA